ncbi:prenyltransferase/squalene oxidase repeat-containing protein [Paenibacillus puerhi]|uniref:hypothetical protein n=1 Tax=Paenibacillus puerhi TaxID=2692622 RepID=UPI00135910E9|nr:hypothetical protein [Paenibacillus puerhi]
MNRRLEAVRTQLDSLFEGFFDWLEGQYDPSTGGFYYARSSQKSGRFEPDIESTAQAYNIIERCGLLRLLDEPMTAQAVRFFQSKQDAASGYFYDADPHMRLDEVMVGRAISYSTGALRRFGAAPLFPLPNERDAAPDYIATPEAYGRWLRSISLANSWRGCDRLCNSAPYLAQMSAERREPYLKEALDYFDRIQDPDTGLWGEGSWYVRLSGTFKLHTFYGRFRVEMPRLREMYRSLLHTLRSEEAVDMCYIRNPISLLAAMKLRPSPEEWLEIAEITVRNMTRLRRGDGGFSRELAHSPAAPNVAQVKQGEHYPDMPHPVRLGLGEVEGDMNAGTQAILIRSLLHSLAGLEPEPLKAPADWFARYR